MRDTTRLLLCVLALAHAAFAQDSDINQLIDKGVKLRKEKQFEDALEALGKAADQAKEAGLRELQMDAVLKVGRLHEMWAAQGKEENARFDDAAKAYRIVAESGSTAQQRRAANNLGVVYLRQHKAPEAAAVFANLLGNYGETAPPVYVVYNAARAHEDAGVTRDAFQLFGRVLNRAPDTDRAYAGALRTGKLEEVNALTDQLVRRGESDMVAKQLLARIPERRELVPVLANVWRATTASWSDYRDEVEPVIGRLQKTDPRTARDLEAIRIAFRADVGPTGSKKGAVRAFREWRDPPARQAALAQLILHAANLHDSFGASDKSVALARSVRHVDPKNTSGPLLASRILMHLARDRGEWNGDLDSTLAELLKETPTYASSRRTAFTERGWYNILLTHVNLASVLSAKPKLAAQLDADVGTRLNMAAAIKRRMGFSDWVAPQLHEQLAKVESGRDKTRLAWLNYIEAAEGFADALDYKRAYESWDRARQLEKSKAYRPTGKEAYRAKKLFRRIERMEKDASEGYKRKKAKK